MINQFLMELPAETGNMLYVIFGWLKWPAFLGVFLGHSLKYSLSIKHKLLLGGIFVIACFWGESFCPLLCSVTNGIFPSVNMGIAFLFFSIIIAIISYTLKVPVMVALDAVAPVYLLGRGVAIIGCIFYGCCHGFASSIGIYSSIAETITFPTVMIDVLLSCLIVLYLVFLAKKNRYYGDGRIFAMSMVLFGILRVVIDILRDNQKLFLMLTIEGFFGILYVIMGVFTFWKLGDIKYEKKTS